MIIDSSSAFPTIHEKTGALLPGLGRYHPFATGNTRTASAATTSGCKRATSSYVQGIAAIVKSWAPRSGTPEEWIDAERAYTALFSSVAGRIVSFSMARWSGRRRPATSTAPNPLARCSF